MREGFEQLLFDRQISLTLSAIMGMTALALSSCSPPTADDRSAEHGNDIGVCLTRILVDEGSSNAAVSYVSNSGAYILRIFSGEYYPTNEAVQIRKEIRVIAAQLSVEFLDDLVERPPQGPDDYDRIYELFGNPEYSRLKSLTRGSAIRFETDSLGMVESVYPDTTNSLVRSGNWLFVASIYQGSESEIPMAQINEALRIIAEATTEAKCP
ncbi:hypothetical protein [Qipengyuania sp. SM2507]